MNQHSIGNGFSSTPQCQQTLEAFAGLFRGRTDAWGTLGGGCVRETVTLDHYRRHLTGKVSLGLYPLDDGACFWAAADLDQPGNASWHNGPDDAMPALMLMEALCYYGANQGLSLEKTKSKGWRVWLFFSTPVPARHVRRLLHAALNKAGLPPSIEVFPKQDFVGKPTPSNPFPVGNYVHLPYFGGGPSGPRSGRVFVSPKTLAPIAHRARCKCICGGKNHGVGLEQAGQNTREMASDLIERAHQEGAKLYLSPALPLDEYGRSETMSPYFANYVACRECAMCTEECPRCVECGELARVLRGKIGWIRLGQGPILCLDCLEKITKERDLGGDQVDHVIHHLDGNHQNNNPSNLVKLCSPCHSRLHEAMRRAGQ